MISTGERWRLGDILPHILSSSFSVMALGGPDFSYVAGMGTMTYIPAHV
jgi:hypothetical protein